MKKNTDNGANPRVSVVMPAYNHEKYVGVAIESVLQQSFGDFEFLIGDDASPDGTVEVIKQYTDPRIVLYAHEKNYGATFNHRFLLERARGEYIALINSDDLWLPGKLEKQVRYLDEHPETVMCSCWCDFVDENGDALNLFGNVFVQPNRTQAEWIEYFFCHGNCICHPGVLIRRSVYEKLCYYNLGMRQLPDFEMWIRMIREGEFYIFQEPLVAHRRFTECSKNTSGPTVNNSVRDVMESYYVLSEFLEDLPDELFSAAFRKYFRDPQAETPAELLCERFFLLEGGTYYMPKINKQAAIMFFLRHYDEAMARVLREKYHYGLKDFHALSCQVDLLDLRLPVEALGAGTNEAKAEELSPQSMMRKYIRENRLQVFALLIMDPESRIYRFVRKIYKTHVCR